jgi:hypothetical protein
MNDDALDQLLRQAFAADQAGTPRVDVSAPVMRRIERASRLRRVVLAIAAIGGLVILIAQLADPALGETLRSLAWPAVPAVQGPIELMAAVAVLAFSAWTMLAADPSL